MSFDVLAILVFLVLCTNIVNVSVHQLKHHTPD